MLLTIKSMVQILARERMLHIPSRVSGTNLHLSIVALKQIWLGIEGQEGVADNDKKGECSRIPLCRPDNLLTLIKNL
jgi:hypothetical protein